MNGVSPMLGLFPDIECPYDDSEFLPYGSIATLDVTPGLETSLSVSQPPRNDYDRSCALS